MFSIVIPLYNKEESITRTLNSIYNQLYKDFEVIIVNDGSKDKSRVIVEEFTFGKSNFFLFNTPNNGVSSARNKGLSLAKNNYICFLDADDTWAEDFLLKINDLIFSYPKMKIYASGYSKIISKKIVRPNLGISSEFKSGLICNYFELFRRTSETLLTSSSIVIERGICDSNLFNEKLKIGEDLDVWFKLILKHKCFGFINENLVFYNFDAENRSINLKLNPENDFVFDLEKFSKYELINQDFKKLLDLLRLQKLKVYHLAGIDDMKVKNILSLIEYNWNLKWKIFYYSPVIFTRFFYSLYFKIEHKSELKI